MALGDLEPMSGILREDSGSFVRLALKRLSSKGKYLLRQGDILFSFRGAQGSLGRVGFVEEEPRIPTITGPSICVIRALPAISSVWLYWYLQWPSVRKAIAAKGTGSSMLTINIEEIRGLPLVLPERDTDEEVVANATTDPDACPCINGAKVTMRKEDGATVLERFRKAVKRERQNRFYPAESDKIFCRGE